MRELAIGEGNVTVDLIRDGVSIHHEQGYNALTTAGLADMMRRLVTLPTKRYEHAQLGNSSVAANSSQTALLAAFTTVGKATAATTSLSGRTAIVIVNWTTDISKTGIDEAGLFTLRTTAGATMMSRYVFAAPISKATADTLKVTWKVKVS